jgi:hypothetical protein
VGKGGGEKPTSPQFARNESVAARRLYQGILLFTWCGTCTLMSWHRNSTLQQQPQPRTQPQPCLAVPHGVSALAGPLHHLLQP